MKLLHYILILHIALLLLASTNFTIVTFAGEGTSFTWNYYTYTSRSGFGYEYVSDYALPQVLTYIAAYATGLITFILIRLRFRWINLIGIVLSALGLVSFLIEGSHWVIDHHRSWIASFPIAFIVLWIFLRAGRLGSKLTNLTI
jgi:hypothetical protein